jgi:hypothetical protein
MRARGRVQLLDEVALSCCRADAPCKGALADVGTPRESSICDAPGNHCDSTGDLTHLDLSESNMRCSLLEVLRPLAEEGNIQDFQLNNNDIQGALDDPRLVRAIGKWAKLRYLELGSLPGLTGAIPADCPAPFNNLVHLGLSFTNVGGELPACLVQSVHELEISNTKVAGKFPHIAGTNLRCAPLDARVPLPRLRRHIRSSLCSICWPTSLWRCVHSTWSGSCAGLQHSCTG